MTPTRIRTLLLIAVVLLAVGWAVVAIVERLHQRLLPVSWTAAAALVLITLGLLVWGLLAKPKLQRKPGRPRLDPLVAARTAALAMAASRTGAAVAGFYGGVAIGLLDSLDTPAGRQYAAAAGAAALASIALSAVGLWLESICRLPGDGDEKSGKSPGQGTNHGGRSTA